MTEHAPENAMTDPDEVARFHDSRNAASGRPEMWMDGSQARAVHAARGD